MENEAKAAGVSPPTSEARVMDYQTALRQLINKEFISSVRYREQQGRAVRVGAYVDPDTNTAPILEFEKALVADLRRRGVPMFAHCVMRDHMEQSRLHALGRSKAAAGLSPHQHGMAVDIIHGTRGWEIDRRSWAIIGHIGKEVAERIGVQISWGGDWRFYDPAHWELAEWRHLAGL